MIQAEGTSLKSGKRWTQSQEKNKTQEQQYLLCKHTDKTLVKVRPHQLKVTHQWAKKIQSGSEWWLGMSRSWNRSSDERQATLRARGGSGTWGKPGSKAQQNLKMRNGANCCLAAAVWYHSRCDSTACDTALCEVPTARQHLQNEHLFDDECERQRQKRSNKA